MVRIDKKQGKKSAEFEVEGAWWHHYLPLFLIEGLTFLFYYPSLRFPFQFDDLANISKNFTIRHDNPLIRWWWHRRWVGDWLNSINYKLTQFDPFSYRLLNVLVHMASGALVFLIVLDICRLLKQEFFVRYAVLIATLTGGLFLLHPLQTQTVSYVIQGRVEGTASFLILLSVYLFMKIVASNSLVQKGILSLFLAAASVLVCGTKENFVLIPGLMLLVDWFFISGRSLPAMKKHKKFYFIFFPFFAFLAAHYLFEMRLISNTKPKSLVNLEFMQYNENNIGNVLTDRVGQSITQGQFAMSQPKVLVHQMRLVLWPFAMSVEYDWRMAKSFFSGEVLLPLILILGLLGTAIFWMRQGIHQLLSFGLLWFFLCVSPRSSFIPSAELACDYKTYLAMMGLYLILALGAARLLHKGIAFFTHGKEKAYFFSRLVLPCIFLCLLPCGLMTYQRNQVWSSNENFWADCVKKAPRKARVHNNYGVALSEAGKYEQAIGEYKRAIELDRYYQDPLSNIAVAYSLTGKPEIAVFWLQQAIKLAPNYPEAYNNLGSLYVDLGKLDEAEAVLQKALSLRSYYGKAHFNLARVAELREDFEKVWAHLKKATEGDLDIAEVFGRLGLAGMKLQKYDEAIAAFERAFALGPCDLNVGFNYANALYLKGNYDKAIGAYQQLIAQDSNDHRYFHNLAETYFAKKDFRKALSVFNEVLKRPNFIGQVIFRIAACHEQLKEFGQAREFLANVMQDGLEDGFKQHLNNEITRYALQEKVNKFGGVSLSDLNDLAQQKRRSQFKDKLLKRRGLLW